VHHLVHQVGVVVQIRTRVPVQNTVVLPEAGAGVLHNGPVEVGVVGVLQREVGVVLVGRARAVVAQSERCHLVRVPDVDHLLNRLHDEDKGDQSCEVLLGEACDVADVGAGVQGDQYEQE